MSNYSQTTFFTPKDSLPPSNPAKTIFGAAYDVEFGNISSAISSKYDSTTISSAPIAFNLGTAALPGITFVGLTGTGWSSDAGGDLIGSTAGVTCVTFDGTTGAATLTDPLTAPSLKVTGATIPANGIYLSAANTLALASNTTLRLQINASGAIVVPQVTAGVAFTITGNASNGVINAVNNSGGAAFIASLVVAGSGYAVTSPAATGCNIFTITQTGQTTWQLSNSGTSNNITLSNGTVSTTWNNTGSIVIAGAPTAASLTVIAGSTSGNGINVTQAAATALNALFLSQTGQSQWKIYQPASSSDFRISSASDALIITNAGNITIPAPTSGTALTVSGFAGSNVASLGGLVIATAGNVTIAAPTSGVALTTTQIAGSAAIIANQVSSAQPAIAINSPNTISAGLQLNQSTVVAWNMYIPASSNNLRWTDQSADRMILTSGGGLQIGSPTGGDLGPGTLNLSNGLSINANPIYAGIPVNVQNASYTFILADANKTIVHNTGAAGHVYTIPANASVAYPVGTAITVVNPIGGGSISLAITTDTLQFLPSGTTGTRTLAASSQATLYKWATNFWTITGVGVT